MIYNKLLQVLAIACQISKGFYIYFTKKNTPCFPKSSFEVCIFQVGPQLWNLPAHLWRASWKPLPGPGVFQKECQLGDWTCWTLWIWLRRLCWRSWSKRHHEWFGRPLGSFQAFVGRRVLCGRGGQAAYRPCPLLRHLWEGCLASLWSALTSRH